MLHPCSGTWGGPENLHAPGYVSEYTTQSSSRSIVNPSFADPSCSRMQVMNDDNAPGLPMVLPKVGNLPEAFLLPRPASSRAGELPNLPWRLDPLTLTTLMILPQAIASAVLEGSDFLRRMIMVLQSTVGFDGRVCVLAL